MKWFQHDSNAIIDPKLKKVIFRFGPSGYAVYFHCLELIASEISLTKATFRLEHDAAIIADDLKFPSDEIQTAPEKVEHIIHFLIELGLLHKENEVITCPKMASRLDNTSSRSPEINKIKKMMAAQYAQEAKQLSENTIESSKLLCRDTEETSKQLCSRRDKNKLDYSTGDQIIAEHSTNPPQKISYGNYGHVYLTENEYAQLEEAVDDREAWIRKLDEGIKRKGYKYKSHYLAILKWAEESGSTHTTSSQSIKDYTEGWGQEKRL